MILLFLLFIIIFTLDVPCFLQKKFEYTEKKKALIFA